MCKENAVFNLSKVIHNQINNDDLKTFYIDFAEISKSEDEFINLLFEALVEFTFGIDAINILSSQDVERFIDACEILYKENRETKKEGDLGEIILHALLRDYLATLPFTGKIHFITIIDKFDKANIKGRAGRLMEHYVGKLYMFHKKLENVNLDIDIPYIDQKELSPEILIHLPEISIKDKNSDEYKIIKDLTREERELFKNNGLKIEGQKAILKLLFQDFDEYYKKLCWTNYPTYEQFNFLINLCWTYLMKSSEKKAPAYTANRLSLMAFNYISMQGNLKLLINEEYNYLLSSKNNTTHCPASLLSKLKNKNNFQIYQLAILNILDATRHWYMYKIPKWLSIMNNLQNYVCSKKKTKPGSYTLLSSLMENNYMPENLSILLEMGIPVSAVNKLKNIYTNDESEDFIISDLKFKIQNSLIDNTLFLDYEFEKIKSEIV